MRYYSLSTTHIYAHIVWLHLGGVNYSNNSIVNLTTIGDNDQALLCRTNANSTACCGHSSTATSVSEWYFPNWSAVGIAGDGGSFYVSRGRSVIELHRRNMVMSPSGVYNTCTFKSEFQQPYHKLHVNLATMQLLTVPHNC